LWTFIEQFKKDFDIPLDGVYTGKMFYGLFDLIKKGFFPKGSRIVAIHTGGLQGNLGFMTKN
ncbi:MAG: 1-aminocyclopropane-1-carboxylate deaminase/D-cysteine desulfhydrase, partial [Gammaproteobacteria bacterium]|nr:1-aminocyclopropane-1-carboxylate deaminase/D-cysteine desulfhydrase [Gammaproteobacteria bacterium]